MKDRAKPKSGKILMRIGIILLVAAVALAGYNVWDDNRAAESVEWVMDMMPDLVKSSVSDPALVQEQSYPDYMVYPDMEMPTVDIDGNEYIGVLSLPSLGKDLPVLSEWSYPNLRVAPCRYAGTAYKKGFVICAHNYTHHFGDIKYLQPGDSLYFTDVDGNVFNYEVEQTEQLEPDHTKYMISDEWDLTLFTCTIGGQFRVAVRCSAASDDPMKLLQNM
ncbi:MAG: sortase [Firmicutes bacterium]|nr:sortase [Bacillota bacterium]